MKLSPISKNLGKFIVAWLHPPTCFEWLTPMTLRLCADLGVGCLWSRWLCSARCDEGCLIIIYSVQTADWFGPDLARLLIIPLKSRCWLTVKCPKCLTMDRTSGHLWLRCLFSDILRFSFCQWRNWSCVNPSFFTVNCSQQCLLLTAGNTLRGYQDTKETSCSTGIVVGICQRSLNINATIMFRRKTGSYNRFLFICWKWEIKEQV